LRGASYLEAIAPVALAHFTRRQVRKLQQTRQQGSLQEHCFQQAACLRKDGALSELDVCACGAHAAV
jgi:hypothetical protein